MRSFYWDNLHAAGWEVQQWLQALEAEYLLTSQVKKLAASDHGISSDSKIGPALTILPPKESFLESQRCETALGDRRMQSLLSVDDGHRADALSQGERSLRVLASFPSSLSRLLQSGSSLLDNAAHIQHEPFSFVLPYV